LCSNHNTQVIWDRGSIYLRWSHLCLPLISEWKCWATSTWLNLWVVQSQTMYLYLWQIHPKLNGICRWHHFVAYEWQWTSVEDRGRWFFIHWFLEQLIRLVVHHWKITMGGLYLFVRKMDDHVVYFKFFDYIC
jgi:hypothetical protein